MIKSVQAQDFLTSAVLKLVATTINAAIVVAFTTMQTATETATETAMVMVSAPDRTTANSQSLLSIGITMAKESTPVHITANPARP